VVAAVVDRGSVANRAGKLRVGSRPGHRAGFNRFVEERAIPVRLHASVEKREIARMEKRNIRAARCMRCELERRKKAPVSADIGTGEVVTPAGENMGTAE